MLWGRAAGRCSYPECRIDLYEDESETDDPTLIGENCHMVADSDDGPRADPSISRDLRNSYNNLILLCRNHHKVIDSQEKKHSLERLREMKAEHERWVREQLGFDAAKQKDDEYYASVVDKWEQLADVENWLNWTSWILGGGQPSIPVYMDENMRLLRPWLLARVWPGRYSELENAFRNFLHVTDDFYNCFHEHAEKLGDDFLQTRKFYQIDRWDEELYAKLLKRFDHHVDLVQDLTLELTRAANLICDRVRQFLMPTYKLSEGRLVIESGPTMDLKVHQYVVQYSPEERAVQKPYPGLIEFMEERAERDIHFGEGPAP